MMRISKFILLKLNKMFKLPVHPFNLSNEGGMSYAEWQFDKGAKTIDYYMPYTAVGAMFEGRRVLDIGCGAAGKSIYYASLGARLVVGLDVVERYREEAVGLARCKGYEDRFVFICADATATGFDTGSFDTIIMNDAVEHVGQPEAVLRECLRLLAPGGKIYLNFPPYYHPYGAHLSDAIGIPWVHAFFSEKTLIAAYKQLVGGLPDGAQRIALRISGGGGSGEIEEYFSYINRMTIRRFQGILKDLPGAKCDYYHEEPLRGFLRPLSRLPILREFFVKMVVAVLEKQDAPPFEP